MCNSGNNGINKRNQWRFSVSINGGEKNVAAWRKAKKTAYLKRKSVAKLAM